MSEPRYKHDSTDCCRFCGEYEGKDLWVCQAGPEAGVVLLRYGDEGYEYDAMSGYTLRSMEWLEASKAHHGLQADAATQKIIEHWRGAFAQVKALCPEFEKVLQWLHKCVPVTEGGE